MNKQKRIAWALVGFLMAAVLVLAPFNGEEAWGANWWDKLGKPQYGGTMNVWIPNNPGHFDPHKYFAGFWGNYELLFSYDWALDRDSFSFKQSFIPPEYYKGWIAESYEYTDPQTITVHLKKGVKWQNKPPLNGRELTSADVVYSYDRMLGTGSGFTEPNPVARGMFGNIDRVVAVDKYTVQFKMKNAAAMSIFDLLNPGPMPCAIVARELDEQDLYKDWKDANGTGPWILSNYVSGSLNEYTRNPDYWGYDERYPQNQLPYADVLKEIVIADKPTAIAALRSGKVDMIERSGLIKSQEAESLIRTNPELQTVDWGANGYELQMRIDRKPFTDIRVRKALQLAVDIETIGKTLFGGKVSATAEGVISPTVKGWAVPYKEWPQSLQDEYTYNPEKAKELLAEAGYPDGFDTNVISNPQFDQELLEAIQSYFKDIGVNMEIKMFPDRPAMDAFAKAGKQDAMTYIPTVGSTANPIRLVSRRTPYTTENYCFVNDPQYNSLIDKAKAASDINEVSQAISRANSYALEKHWTLTTFGLVTTQFWHPWLKGNSGEKFFVQQWNSFWYVTRFWVDQDLKNQ